MIAETTTEAPQNHAEVGADSYADPSIIAQVREYGLTALPDDCRPDPWSEVPEPREIERDDDRVDEYTLQLAGRKVGHNGGSKQKNKRVNARPLTPLERMDRRVLAMARTESTAFSPETPTQTAERHLAAERKRIERREKNAIGRPRKGVEVREMYGVRLEPQTAESIRAAGYSLRDFIEEHAARLAHESVAA